MEDIGSGGAVGEILRVGMEDEIRRSEIVERF